MTLVDPQGQPVSSREIGRCPRCGEKFSKRSVHTFFGGHWKRICECGHVYDQGQGLPPLEED